MSGTVIHKRRLVGNSVASGCRGRGIKTTSAAIGSKIKINLRTISGFDPATQCAPHIDPISVHGIPIHAAFHNKCPRRIYRMTETSVPTDETNLLVPSTMEGGSPAKR